MNSSKAFSLSDHRIMTISSTTFNFALSLPINSYVAWLMVNGAGGTLRAEFLPINLAVFEILFCLLSVGTLLRIAFPSLKFLSTFPNGFLWSGRPILQCCICIEQFLAVVHPVLFLRYKPLRYKAAFSAVAWAVIFGLSLLYTFIPTQGKHNVFVSECVILISVMLFCYFSVLVTLKRPLPGEGGQERDYSMKRRAFLKVLVILVSFVGTYFLWCVAILTSLSNWNSYTRRTLLKVCTFITYVSGLVQPLLYLKRIGKCSCNKAV